MKPAGAPDVGVGEILLLAVGLAMDAAAVSVARGLAVPKVGLRHAVLVAVFFGGAQALMPLLGFFLGQEVGPLIAAIDHWVAFALLGFLGIRMIKEALSDDDDDDDTMTGADPFALATMATLAIATSIDAFAVGVILPGQGAPLLPTIAAIGVVTGALSVMGLLLGARLGARLGSKMDIVGGVVLVGLGCKFLLDGLTSG